MVRPSVKRLLEANRKMSVLEVFLPDAEAALAGRNSKDLPMHVRHSSVMVQLMDA